MRRTLRGAVLVIGALVVLTGAMFALQQTLYARPPVLDLTPRSGAAAVVAAPPAAPVVTDPAPSATAGAGVPRIDGRWLRRTAVRSGVPVVALRAYARAELMSPADCGLGWTTLAGVGWVESQHGTLGDRTLLGDGHSSSRILGPALDGTGGFKAIAASATSTTYHGDPRWDHAVGPMQFIPTTWETWASDGDGDGVADPNDLDDAAYAAARYLCAGGRDLTSASGWTSGVLSYNNASAYVSAVHSAASTYAERTA